MSKTIRKPWSGRFRQATGHLVEEFTSSLPFDVRLYPYDIRGSIAHCRMLMKQRIITRQEGERILEGLQEIGEEIAQGRMAFAPGDEDIHMAIERRLLEKIGSVGGKLHSARSRNDQVVLDERLYVKTVIKEIDLLVERLQKELAHMAEKHLGVVMPGYTHLQRAQPVLFSHHLLAYHDMLERDRRRLADCAGRTDVLPLGSAALGGTTLPIDRAYLARLLGFARISDNSIDAVADRDFIAEFLAHCAILAMHVSRLAEELVLWSTAEFDFIELPDAFCTGSSIMPQKKNPDVPELIRGKAGRVFGNLFALLTVLKGLPLAYNRDLQEDKEPLFDSADSMKSILSVLTALLPKVRVKEVRMREAAGGFSLATDVAEYLVEKGIPFREAHGIVGSVVRYCLKKGRGLEDLRLEEWRRFSPRFGSDIFSRLTLESAVERRRGVGGTASANIRKRLRAINTRH